MLISTQLLTLPAKKINVKTNIQSSRLDQFSRTRHSAVDPRWEIAKLRQKLPTGVETTNWNDLASALNKQGLSEHIPFLSQAYQVADVAHAGVTRQEGTAYIHHPARVCENLISKHGIKDPNVLAAALLHDVVEDSPLTVSDIREQFGSKTAEYVDWLTKPEASKFASKQARNEFQAQRIAKAPREVRMVKLADRLDNIGDLHLLPANGKMPRYLKDTRENYLPLAQATDAKMTSAIQTRLNQLEQLHFLESQTATKAA